MKTNMDFKEFDNYVKSYCPLNKDKSRYLILFNAGNFAFYKLDEKTKLLIKEK